MVQFHIWYNNEYRQYCWYSGCWNILIRAWLHLVSSDRGPCCVHLIWTIHRVWVVAMICFHHIHSPRVSSVIYQSVVLQWETKQEPNLLSNSSRVSENITSLIKGSIGQINDNSLGFSPLNKETMSFSVLHSWCWDATAAIVQWVPSGFTSAKLSVNLARHLGKLCEVSSFASVSGVENGVFPNEIVATFSYETKEPLRPSQLCSGI